ncbi:arginine--tRNA ligase, partial [Candidatus Gottesmanbacteria bacterium]|nr:arginine--tRNA ligase [Candidatus Gottesmanbacteria bacterium]
MMIKNQIITDLKKALEKLGITGVEPVLEHPGQMNHGDYSTNIALSFARRCLTKLDFKSSLDLAKKIVDAFPKTDYLEKIEVAPPGFINFWLKTDFLSRKLEEVLKEGDDYGKAIRHTPYAKIMVEFAHPNTHKLFHIGHLRNISLGESIVRLLESQGTKVIRANYQGDVGLHIAKAIYGILQKKRHSGKVASDDRIQNRFWTSQNDDNSDEKIAFLGKCYAEGNRAYESDPNAKEEIEKINTKIYEKDAEVYSLWETTRQWSLEYFERIYKRVYSHFDRYYFEGEVAEPGKKLVLENLKRSLQVFEKSEGAIIFPGKKYGLHNRVFINQVGLPTYEAKDMALAKLQFSEFKPDLIIHVVGPEQKGYFEVLF